MTTIEVTQEDIDSGVAADCYLCPVATAALRVAKPLGYECVVVGSEDLSFKRRFGVMFQTYVSEQLPDIARQFIIDFDDTADVPAPRNELKPFTFEIQDIPRIK